MNCELCNEPIVDCQCFGEACDCPYGATGIFKVQIQASIRAAKAEAWEEGSFLYHNETEHGTIAPNPYLEDSK